MWCIPPKQSAAFVYHMEDVLAVYQKPYDSRHPVLCMDETFKQLIGQVREPLPMIPGEIERVDHVYQRNGVASLFIAFEPLAGWRTVTVTDHRRRQEWAWFMRELIDGRYKQADKIILVMDQLNTHTSASFYQVFEPAEAKRLADKLEIHHTPKHGSWLNMAEIELAALSKQCLSRRIARQATLVKQIQAWQVKRNGNKNKVDWQFTNEKARTKLKRLYPSIED